MLRAILLASPVVLAVVVSCTGSDTAEFKDVGPAGSGTAGSSNSSSGASAGGTSAQAGSNATAGSNAGAGKSNNGGNGNMAGNGNTAGKQSGGGNGNGNAGGAPDGGASPNGGAPGDAGANTGGTNTGGTNTGGTNTGGTNGGPLCPDIFGTYTIVDVNGGVDCNGLNKNAMQSIQGTEVVCRAHFVSVGVNPQANIGVNGGAGLDENGDFTGAMLMFNKTQRSPCSGQWDDGNERMTVRCGGQGDQCTVVMERN